jgi:hypothetical protein
VVPRAKNTPERIHRQTRRLRFGVFRKSFHCWGKTGPKPDTPILNARGTSPWFIRRCSKEGFPLLGECLGHREIGETAIGGAEEPSCCDERDVQ